VSADIVVLHQLDNTSDNYWAINKVQSLDATHDVWMGSRGSKLAYFQLKNRGWKERMQQKLDLGYRWVGDVTIDTETCTVIPLVQTTGDDLEVPASLWYRVSNEIPIHHIRDYLDITMHLLSEYCTGEVAKLS